MPADRANGRSFKLLKPLDINPEFCILNVSFFKEEEFPKDSLKQYYYYCKENRFFVTTSCYAAWLSSRRTNDHGKIIPAVPTDLHESVRVFFFDDNLNLNGKGSCESYGICNLRDIDTGEYVDFTEHANGFRHSRHYGHTHVAHSSLYSNVLVQVNILDAMVNEDYFTSIIAQHTEPGEQVIVFADANGTVVWDDTVAGKDVSQMLLATMFNFAEARPRSPDCEFSWDSRPAVKLERRRNLKELVLETYEMGKTSNFWHPATCRRFMEESSASET